MKHSIFKVGDKVRIKKDWRSSWSCSWEPSGSYEFRVTEVVDHEFGPGVRVELLDPVAEVLSRLDGKEPTWKTGHFWIDEWFELIEEENARSR